MVSLTSERGKGTSKLIISEDLARKNVFVQAWVLTAVHLHMKADLQLTLCSLETVSFYQTMNQYNYFTGTTRLKVTLREIIKTLYRIGHDTYDKGRFCVDSMRNPRGYVWIICSAIEHSLFARLRLCCSSKLSNSFWSSIL